MGEVLEKPVPRPDWITTREAAEISGYHVNYIRRLIRRGKIAAEKKGSMWWVDGDSLNNPRGGMDIHTAG